MRESGMLLHITSLPEKGGIGTLGGAAYEFVDFLREAGMKIWQVLPVGPTGYGESPYQSASTYAGNPLLIDLKTLEKDGILPAGAFEELPDGDQADFDAVRASKEKALRLAFAHDPMDAERAEFLRQNKWAADYALFMALKQHFGGGSWQEWPEELRLRKPLTLQKYRDELKNEIAYHIFVQVLFFRQWFALRKYANERGVKLFGDMPIYVAEDSADVWANPQYFQLDADRRPIRVAGVPPDYFSEDGQLWGNPLYDWETLKRRKFDWWMDRLRGMGRLYDMIRIDHFIGFANYYSIPYGAKNARVGAWVLAPGKELFKRAKYEVPGLTVIAEDLGELTNRVRRLRDWCGFPGMKVLGFAFDGGEENIHRPEHYPVNAIAYTGTHDNDTALGFWEKATEEQKKSATEQLRLRPGDDVVGKMIECVFSTPPERVVIPMQDFLRLGGAARMNLPGTVGGNWGWRMTEKAPDSVKEEIKELIARYDRAGG